jgi:ferredoxin
MISIDHARCGYCGGCVSVCPVGALTLAETRLIASLECIDCGDCVAACPVGALQLQPPEIGQPDRPLRRRYDLVVVGAGPGGSTAAYEAAQQGLSVLPLEKRQEIGSPVRCAEGVGHDALVKFIEPDARWVAAEVSRAQITVVHNGEATVRRAEGGRGYVLERRVFDRVLAEQAARAGAEVRVKTAVTGLLTEGDQVRDVEIQRGDFLAGSRPVEVEARVVIPPTGSRPRWDAGPGWTCSSHCATRWSAPSTCWPGLRSTPRAPATRSTTG